MIFYVLAMARKRRKCQHPVQQQNNNFWGGKRGKNYCKTNQSFYLFMSLRVGWWVCMLCKYIQFLVDRAQVVLGKSLALIVLALKMCVLNFGKTKSHSFSTMKT